MPPKTNAERQKAYRERLKKENPDKYERNRVKHLAKVKENIKKKKESLTEDDKEELREKWRKINAKRAEIKNKSVTTTQSNTISVLEVSKTPKKSNILKERLKKLTKENADLKRRNKTLRQAYNRMKMRMDILKKILHEQTELASEPIETALTPHCDQTPLTKTNTFLEDTIPNICEAEKIKVKKKLLLLNTITDSLKTEFNKANSKEKNVLKKVATNEIANKHKLKTAISHALGLKGRIRTMKTRNEIKKYKKDIQDFFEREDISRPSAGKNECITKNKEKVQKRYLNKPIYKLYRQYKAEGGKASLQTFYRFRPFFIVKPRLQDRNTCACIKHCNLSFKAIILKKLGLLQTCDIDELMKEVTCSKCFECFYSECSDCKYKKLAIDPKINENSPVEWLQWKMGTYTYTKIGKEKTEEKQTKKYSKQIVKGTLNTLIKEFQDDVQNFKIHYFNVSHQYLAWKKCIENLDDDEAALICDFSENFSCKQSEEIQAVHFGGSRNQITLHTCVLYRKNMKPQGICSISPNNEHGPGAIWAHLDPIMKLCKEINIKKMHIFSDSPATQYRQKHNFFLFQKKIKDFEFEYATWNFFEASHGKGPADGIGGAIKRQLDDYISYGNDITNAKEAYDYLKVNSKVKIFYINEKDIQEMTKIIPDNVIPIKGTMKLHQISTDGKPTIQYKWLSCFDCQKNFYCDCYNRKEHQLVETNTHIGMKTVQRGNKRKALKKRNPAGKRLKRINSSTTTDDHISISIHSDSDLIDMVSEDECNEIHGNNNTDNEEICENLGAKIEKSDITEKTEFKVKEDTISNQGESETPEAEEKVTMLSSSRCMSANRAFYGTEIKCLKVEGLTTTKDETYSTIQENRKTTLNYQEIIKEEKHTINNTDRPTVETENQQKEQITCHKDEELTTDPNLMPMIFLEDLVSDEVIIKDDLKDYMFDDMPFNKEEFNFTDEDNINRDVITQNNNVIEDNPNPEQNNINNENVNRRKHGLIILKEEKLENIHSKKKVVYKGLKPLSLNNYINVPKRTKKPKAEKPIVKPKEPQKNNKSFKDTEIYEALMDSD